MREVLVPPMKNIVRRLVIECSTPRLSDGKLEDPAIRAARMDMEEVLTELREEEGVWFDGFDWAERRRNDGHEREKRESGSGSDDSSTSSGSRSSNGMSPVLSTTTLQTTPSPPPMLVGEETGKKVNGEEQYNERSGRMAELPGLTKPVTIAIGPVLDPPKLLRAIPYVPVTASHMPHYSLEAFKAVCLTPALSTCDLTLFRFGEKPVHHCIIVDVGSVNVLWPRLMLPTATIPLPQLYLPKRKHRIPPLLKRQEIAP
jgi:hypothetical protein